VDYTIVYQDNDRLGEASFTATGIGDNFEGTLTGTFNLIDGASYTLHYEYAASTLTATLIGGTYHGAAAAFAIDIPQTVEHDGATYTVTAIADGAFGGSVTNDVSAEARKLSAVTIPKTVQSIGAYAFGVADDAAQTGAFAKLTHVVFAEDSALQSIGDSAFRNTAITCITIPAGVTTIGDRAFRDCAALTEVTFLSGSAGKPEASAFATTSGNTPFAHDAGVTAYGYDEATGIRAFVETWYVPTGAGTLNLGWTWQSLGSAPVDPGTGEGVGLPGSGDFNGDGIVTTADASSARKAALGAMEITQAQRLAIDVNRDGYITTADSSAIRRMALGL